MTVKRPSTWIVRVESDCQFALGRQPDGVAPRARKAPAIDGHNLEVVAVQVHGMAHHALIAKGQFDPLAGTDRARQVLSPDPAVDSPHTGRNVTPKHKDMPSHPFLP